MNRENTIQLTIETPAIGDVVMEIPSSSINEENEFIIEIPNRIFWGGTSYIKLDLTHIVENDIELFKKLNDISDVQHQVYIDTLCIYGVKISGNYIRIQYWFHQDNNTDSHRMCAGQLTHCNERGSATNKEIKVFPECYSSGVCVYW